MDVQEPYDRGLQRRIEMFGREAVEKRVSALGNFGEPLQHIVNAYAYGDVWSRSALPPATPPNCAFICKAL
jgi:4-carboxymuconolactone decarboxylase